MKTKKELINYLEEENKKVVDSWQHWHDKTKDNNCSNKECLEAREMCEWFAGQYHIIQKLLEKIK